MQDQRQAGGANTENPENIALIGFMGAGKSAVGSLLARKLHMDFVDLDEVIVAQAGVSVSEIFATEGERGFRQRESAALRKALRGEGKVLSCGGGVVLLDTNIELLRDRCRIFLLNISEKKAVERLSESEDRPLIAGGDLESKVHELLEKRYQIYLEAADEVVEAEDASPRELAEEIAARWRRYRYGRPEGNTQFT